jgi:hypothetical protein
MRNLSTEFARPSLIPEAPDWPDDAFPARMIAELANFDRSWIQDAEYDEDTGACIAHPKSLNAKQFAALARLENRKPWRRYNDITITPDGDRMKVTITPGPDSIKRK